MPYQMGQLTKASPWRKSIVEIAAFSNGELNFSDTHPNMFYINNEGADDLFISLSTTPTAQDYQFKAGGKKTSVFGQPFGTTTMYIYNPADHNVSITVWSYSGEFDMTLLKDFEIDAESIKFDGIIKGFASGAALPAGNNKIGNVGVTGSLPAGTNNIGSVQVANMPTMPDVSGLSKETTLASLLLAVQNLSIPSTESLATETTLSALKAAVDGLQIPSGVATETTLNAVKTAIQNLDVGGGTPKIDKIASSKMTVDKGVYTSTDIGQSLTSSYPSTITFTIFNSGDYDVEIKLVNETGNLVFTIPPNTTVSDLKISAMSGEVLGMVKSETGYPDDATATIYMWATVE